MNSTYASNLLFRRGKKFLFKSINDLIPSTSSEDAIDLLKLFLTFNPMKRISSKEALEHVHFSDFYKSEECKTLYYDVIPPVEESNKLSISQYREMLFDVLFIIKMY